MIFRRWTAQLKSSSASGSSDGGAGEWAAADVTIAGGEITVASKSWNRISTEAAAASDDVDTINGLTVGQEVILSIKTAGKTVVLKHGTGNLDLTGGVDITLVDLKDRGRLMYDGTNLVEASSRP